MNLIIIFLASMIPGTFFLGVYDVLTKKILREKIPEGLLLGVTLAISGLVLSLISLFIGYPRIESVFWFAFVITVVLNVFGQLAWYKAFKREDASLIAPLRFTIPILVLATGFLVLREAPSFLGIVGILITVFGLWLLFNFHAGFSKQTLWRIVKNPGVLWGIAGAFSFSLSFPFDKKAVISSSALFFSGNAFLAIGIISLLIAFFGNRLQKNKAVFKTLWSVRTILLPNILFHAAGVFLANFALNFSLAAYASALKRLQVFWTLILSGRVLKEKNILKKLIAAAVMLFGMAVTVFLG